MEKISLIIPVYNEKEVIKSLLSKWEKELKKYRLKYDFVICEDGSTDGTAEEVIKLKKTFPIVLSQAKERRGYGRALIEGIKKAKSKYLLCVDGDDSYAPADFPEFWRKRKLASVIRGYRKARKDNLFRKVASFHFRLLFWLLFGSFLPDPSCPLVLFQRQKILPIVNQLSFLNEGFWWGFMAVCLKEKISFLSIQVRHLARKKGKTKVYLFYRIPSIAIRNISGMVKLRF